MKKLRLNRVRVLSVFIFISTLAFSNNSTIVEYKNKISELKEFDNSYYSKVIQDAVLTLNNIFNSNDKNKTGLGQTKITVNPGRTQNLGDGVTANVTTARGGTFSYQYNAEGAINVNGYVVNTEGWWLNQQGTRGSQSVKVAFSKNVRTVYMVVQHLSNFGNDSHLPGNQRGAFENLSAEVNGRSHSFNSGRFRNVAGNAPRISGTTIDPVVSNVCVSYNLFGCLDTAFGVGEFQYTFDVGNEGIETIQVNLNAVKGNAKGAHVRLYATGVVETSSDLVANLDRFTVPYEVTTRLPRSVRQNDDLDGLNQNNVYVQICDQASLNGTLSVINSPNNGVFDFTPDRGFTGKTSFTYRLVDSNNPSNTSNCATVEITVEDDPNPNAIPIARDNYYFQTTYEGSVNGNVIHNTDVFNSQADDEGDAPARVTTNTNPINGGTVVVQPSGIFIYTPRANHTGETDQFTYTIKDSNGPETSTATVTIRLQQAAPNEVPIARNNEYTAVPEVQLTGNVILNTDDVNTQADDQGDAPATISSNTNPQKGSLDLRADGGFTYIARAGATGTDSFTYTIKDSNGPETSTATVTINIDAPIPDDNKLPIARNNYYTCVAGMTRQGNVIDDTDIFNHESDYEGDAPAHVPTNQGTIPTSLGQIIFTTQDGDFLYIANPGVTGVDQIPYTITDSKGANGGPGDSSQALIMINVTPAPVNEIPIAKDNVYTATHNVLLEGNVISDDDAANGQDYEGDAPAVVVSNTTASKGTLILSENGDFSYIVHNGESGSDTFTYTIKDSNGTEESTATVTINIEEDNVLPIAYDNSYSGVGQIPITGNVLIDVDPDSLEVDFQGDAPAVVSSNTDPTYGTVTVNPDGSFIYLANDNETRDDSFTYTIVDDNGPEESTATVYIHIDALSPTVPCEAIQEPGIVRPAKLNIDEGESNSFRLTGYQNVDDISWEIFPSDGVSQNTGDGPYTGDIFFNYGGTYTVIFYLENNTTPEGCQIPANSFATSNFDVNALPGSCELPSFTDIEVTPSSAAIEIGGTASFDLNGGTPSTWIDWRIMPNRGVTPNGGSTRHTGDVTFDSPGVYTVIFTITNEGDNSCNPVQASATAQIAVGTDACSAPSPITIVPNIADLDDVKVGDVISFDTTGGHPGDMSWQITPADAVDNASGDGFATGDLTVMKEGDLTITFTTTNSSSPNNCTTPISVSQSTTINVEGGVVALVPDFATTLNTNANIFYEGQEFKFVATVGEITGNNSIIGQPVILTINDAPFFDFVFDPNFQGTQLGKPFDNTEWEYLGETFGIHSFKYRDAIYPGNGFKAIGFSGLIDFGGAVGEIDLSASVMDGSGGEEVITNNGSSSTISIITN